MPSGHNGYPAEQKSAQSDIQCAENAAENRAENAAGGSGRPVDLGVALAAGLGAPGVQVRVR